MVKSATLLIRLIIANSSIIPVIMSITEVNLALENAGVKASNTLTLQLFGDKVIPMLKLQAILLKTLSIG